MEQRKKMWKDGEVKGKDDISPLENEIKR